LNGRCDFVRWAVGADALVVLAGDSLHVVAADAPGLTIKPAQLADGSFAGMVMFDGGEAESIALPAAAAAASLATVQLCYVAEMVGAMALLYEQTADYARQRRQFGAAIGSFQAVQHKLARMFVALEQARSLLLKAGLADRDAAGFERGVIATKAYVAEAAQRLAEDAVQLHGGMGVTDELAIGRGLRRVMLLARLFGGAGEARARLAA
jgi:alkylation response protein AidB-like acyl-CoA dehydrogenase